MFAVDTQHATMESIKFISSENIIRAELYFINGDFYDYEMLKMVKPNQVIILDQNTKAAEQPRNSQLITSYTIKPEKCETQ